MRVEKGELGGGETTDGAAPRRLKWSRQGCIGERRSIEDCNEDGMADGAVAKRLQTSSQSVALMGMESLRDVDIYQQSYQCMMIKSTYRANNVVYHKHKATTDAPLLAQTFTDEVCMECALDWAQAYSWTWSGLLGDGEGSREKHSLGSSEFENHRDACSVSRG